ncbi:MAG: hypothetical protein IPK14_12940 [Blastocatellia bacterium]|nr:hypothetical protein [Blastocatellia bacterium]
MSIWQIAFAQVNPIFENISKNQGLSDNTVNAFAQDLDGFYGLLQIMDLTNMMGLILKSTLATLTL